MPNRMFIEQRVRGLWSAPALFIAVVVAASVNLAVKRRSLPVLIGVVAIWIALAWLIGFLYRLAPSRRLARAEVIPGAALAAAVIVGLSYVYPFYAQLLDQLGSGEQLFAAALGLIAWLYLIGHALPRSPRTWPISSRSP